MNTDDPGTPDKGEWEINISFNSEITSNERELENPLLDFNYGYNEQTQLKIEFPYLFSKENGGKYNSRFGDLSLGVKYRFFDEENSIAAFSIYPQVTISTENHGLNEYLFPVQIEKSFGKIVIGADLGYINLENEFEYFHNGILLGYRFSDNLEVMGELNFQAETNNLGDPYGSVNFGMRYVINEKFILINSFGTGIITPEQESKTKLVSFVGVQMIL